MKKNIFKLSALALTGAMALFSCGTKEEVTPTAGKPTVDVAFVASDFGVIKDNFKVSTTVSTDGDSAFINLSVNGTEATGAIYMMYQKDNDKAVKFQSQPGGGSLPSAGYIGASFDGTIKNNFNYKSSGDYTFDVPGNISKAWKLTIPVKLRKDATSKSDVFTIWITKSAGTGRFDNPAKNLAYGVAVVTLNYTNEALINNYETVLGSAANKATGSLFATKTGSNYGRAYANDTVPTVGQTLVDFAFNDFTASKYTFGSFHTSTGAEDADVKSGFGAVDKITRVIKIAAADATTTFASVTGDASLAAEVNKVLNSTSTSNKVTLNTDPTGKTLAFITADGKKGLIYVNSASNLSTATGEISIQVKVQR